MTGTELMDGFVEWMKTEVAPEIELKVPDDDRNDGSYEYLTATPSVFAYFVPPEEIDIAEHRVPSICIQFLETEANYLGSSGKEKKIRVKLILETWNPGNHIQYTPTEDIEEVGGVKYNIEKVDYERNLDGWRDLSNLQDLILSKIQGTEFIAGTRVDLTSVKYGMYKDENMSLYLLYPYYLGYIEFTATCGVARVTPSLYEEIL